LEKTELELQRRQQQSSHEHRHHQQQPTHQLLIQPQLQQQLPSDSNLEIIAEIQHPPPQPPIDINDFKDQVYQIFNQLHNDYDAVKYLVDQHITTQEQYNNKLTEFNTKQQQLEQLESAIRQFQSEMIVEIQRTKTEVPNQVKKVLLEHLQFEQQVKQLSTILTSNRKLSTTNQNPSISFQFENLPELRMECASWSDQTLYDCFDSNLIDIDLVL
jgi:gas vesicle protein